MLVRVQHEHRRVPGEQLCERRPRVCGAAEAAPTTAKLKATATTTRLIPISIPAHEAGMLCNGHGWPLVMIAMLCAAPTLAAVPGSLRTTGRLLRTSGDERCIPWRPRDQDRITRPEGRVRRP